MLFYNKTLHNRCLLAILQSYLFSSKCCFWKIILWKFWLLLKLVVLFCLKMLLFDKSRIHCERYQMFWKKKACLRVIHDFPQATSSTSHNKIEKPLGGVCLYPGNTMRYFYHVTEAATSGVLRKSFLKILGNALKKYLWKNSILVKLQDVPLQRF